MKICVLGSGSWGTALAQVLADNHHEVVVWGKSPEEIADLKLHRNTKYFPEVLVNPAIEATLDFDTVTTADILLLAVPTGAVEEVSRQAASVLDHPVIVINVAKGFHPTTHQRLSEVIKECFTPETDVYKRQLESRPFYCPGAAASGPRNGRRPGTNRPN